MLSIYPLGSVMANPIADLSKVGSAKLEVFFFDIYFSTLYSKSGKYSEDEKKFNSFANRPLKKKTKVYNNLLDFAESLL